MQQNDGQPVNGQRVPTTSALRRNTRAGRQSGYLKGILPKEILPKENLRGSLAAGRDGKIQSGSHLSGHEVSGGIVFTRENYPVGGIEEVMRRLQRLTAQGLTNPSVRQLALDVTRGIEKDPDTGFPDRRDRTAIARALYNYIVSRIAYVHDPHGVEQIQSAQATLYYRTGDCDDMSVLSAALLGSLGVPVRFVIIGTNPARPDAFTHIYVEYLTHGGQWTAFDPVIEDGVGIAVPASAVTIRRTYDVFAGGGPAVLATLAGTGTLGQLGTALAGAENPNIYEPGTLSLYITGEREADGVFMLDVELQTYRNLGIGICRDVWIIARTEPGEIVAASHFWPSWPKCTAQGTLRFDRGDFDRSTPVRVIAYYGSEYKAFDSDGVRVTLEEIEAGNGTVIGSTPFYTFTPGQSGGIVRTPPGGFGGVLDRFAEVVRTVGIVGAVGATAYLAWPLLSLVRGEAAEAAERAASEKEEDGNE